MHIGKLVVGLLLLSINRGDVGVPTHGSVPGPHAPARTSGDLEAQVPPIPRDDLRQALAAERRAQESTLPAAEGREVASLYDRASGGPIWIDAAGRLTGQARAGLALLEGADAEGLDPADYGAPMLSALAASLVGPSLAPAPLAAQFDVRMTAGALRYFRHIHLGRIDPRTLGLQITIPADEHDFVGLLWSAVEGGRVGETAAELAPPLAQYRALRSMLARYRSLAADLGETPVFAAALRPGDPFADLPTLHRLLVTVGDLPIDTPLPASGIYDGTISAGVARFQARHGLDADGVIGRLTQEAMQVPLSWRARQIELALERLRWLPDLSGRRLIAVNIPMFRLWALDSVLSNDVPDLTMAVIVGRALDTSTPVFADSIQYVIFRPYWNVPQSILRGEILPAIRRDPDYLARQNMEIVRGQADASPVLTPTAEHIAQLGTGNVRVRQRPGPSNALGLVKFMFPNYNNVYMHGTPAPQLFKHSRRDFSHGCIRVEDPVGLAEWVLKRNPSWTRDQVLAAMNGAPNRRVDLLEPIQVVIFYTTAVVMPEDGAVHFANDVYRQDALLDKAL